MANTQGTNKTSKRKWKSISAVLVILGIMLTLYPLFTDGYSRLFQSILLNNASSANKTAAPDAAADSTIAVNAAQQPFMVIEIPAIELKAAVVKGTAADDLCKGPGWYPQSALPGQGNTAIAAHRTMYGAWFRHLDSLAANDKITITYAGQIYHYTVKKVCPVAKNDWSVIKPCGYSALTLTTCHPVGSAKQRLVVRAALTKVDGK